MNYREQLICNRVSSHVTSTGMESMKEICTQETAVFRTIVTVVITYGENLICDRFLLAVRIFMCLFKLAYLQKDFIQSEQLSGFKQDLFRDLSCYYIV